jgi:hypothetical protein
MVGISAPLTDWMPHQEADDARGRLATASAQDCADVAAEPDMATALGWWSELPNKWTPVGWRDHLFRFNVLFNGTLIAQPNLNRRTSQWAGQGIQLSFMPSPLRTFGIGSLISEFPRHDDGRVIQEWTRDPAPVLRSNWVEDGLLLSQDIFAHLAGDGSTQTGSEPLFAWVRLSIVGAVEGIPLPDRYAFALKVNAPHINTSEEIRNNLFYDLTRARYPRELSASSQHYSSDEGYRLVEPDRAIRLGFPPRQKCTIDFQQHKPTDRDSLLLIGMSSRIGTSVDLLVPMLPTQEEIYRKELNLGYERALEEANQFWRTQLATVATIHTPEDQINEAFKHSVRITEMITERDPKTGYCSMLTGSWTYAGVWSTPNSITMVFLLDNLGHHEMVEKYLQVFKETQGTIGPPGSAFAGLSHEGYLGTPPSLQEVNWLSDHGCLLWAIANHVLVSNSATYEQEWISTIVKACEFIKAARAIHVKGAIAGVMPPAVQNDYETEVQGVWSDGWIYKGLITAIKCLKRIEHPRTSEFVNEAKAYKSAYATALRQETLRMPTWTDSSGKIHHLVPPCLSGDTAAEIRRSESYLDTGPLFLVFAGLLDPTDELMRSTLLWFREGPPTKVYRYDSNCFQIGSLWHEMSSAEPCYSWNLFHSLALGDRPKFIEGMYSLFAGALSRQTWEMCETRGGINSITPCLPSFYAARLAVIDDQSFLGELHLLRLVPLAWLRKEGLAFSAIPTEYGPVTLRAWLPTPDDLHVQFEPQYRNRPSRVVLHHPPTSALKHLTINGRTMESKGDTFIVN